MTNIFKKMLTTVHYQKEKYYFRLSITMQNIPKCYPNHNCFLPYLDTQIIDKKNVKC